MKIDPDAPAFPSQNGVQYDPGLSIRAEIASRAMAGLLASGHFTKPCEDTENRCARAYSLDSLSKGEFEMDEDRPSPTFIFESKECREEYIDDEDVVDSKLAYDCVECAISLADALIAELNKEDK
jgi:hypothetical protein